jgi:GNAT superfamily N-acetyltransferase
MNNNPNNLKFKPLTPETWEDFKILMGEKGGCGGCWCMSWRLRPKEFHSKAGRKNMNAMKKLVTKNNPIGVIAYHKNQPVGWCAIAPRENYVRLDNSKVLARVDDKPVWSITCFFIVKAFRRKGFSLELLRGVIKYCKKNRVKIIEGYPTIPYQGKTPDAFLWTGILSTFEKAGFTIALQRSKARPILRYYL